LDFEDVLSMVGVGVDIDCVVDVALDIVGISVYVELGGGIGVNVGYGMGVDVGGGIGVNVGYGMGVDVGGGGGGNVSVGYLQIRKVGCA